MKTLITTLLLAFIALAASAQSKTDFVELTDGDTLYGIVKAIEPTQIKFQPKGSEKTTIITLGLIKSFQRNSLIRYPQKELEADIAGLQLAEQDLHWAGNKLQGAANTFYAGAAMTIVGTIGTAVGLALISNESTADNRTGEVILYAGGAMAGAGAIVSMTAFISISKAGITLQGIKLTK